MKPWLSEQNQFLCSSGSQNLNIWYVSFWCHFQLWYHFSIPLLFFQFSLYLWKWQRKYFSPLVRRLSNPVSNSCLTLFWKVLSKNSFAKLPRFLPYLSHSGVTCMGNNSGKGLWTDSNAQSLSSLQYWGIERQQESWKWRNEIYLEIEEIRKKVFLVWTLFLTIVISF